jgi:hypothetical protein
MLSSHKFFFTSISTHLTFFSTSDEVKIWDRCSTVAGVGGLWRGRRRREGLEAGDVIGVGGSLGSATVARGKRRVR